MAMALVKIYLVSGWTFKVKAKTAYPGDILERESLCKLFCLGKILTGDS
jgi:hypothetical protein